MKSTMKVKNDDAQLKNLRHQFIYCLTPQAAQISDRNPVRPGLNPTRQARGKRRSILKAVETLILFLFFFSFLSFFYSFPILSLLISNHQRLNDIYSLINTLYILRTEL